MSCFIANDIKMENVIKKNDVSQKWHGNGNKAHTYIADTKNTHYSNQTRNNQFNNNHITHFNFIDSTHAR